MPYVAARSMKFNGVMHQQGEAVDVVGWGEHTIDDMLNLGWLSYVPDNFSTGGQPKYTGYGPPGTIADAVPGDVYLDTTTGDLYTLS